MSEHAERAEAKVARVEAALEEFSAKSAAMSPDDYRTGQDHLSPAFREVNYRDALRALIALWNEFEAALRTALSDGSDQ